MEVASLELCEKLFKLSGWELPTIGSGLWAVYPDDTQVLWADKRPHHFDEVIKSYPAYSLGFLIRKLPEGSLIRRDHKWGTAELDGERFEPADTPEDCVALLAIRLIEEGIINVETS